MSAAGGGAEEALAHALAGMSGSCMAMLLLYPLDTIRSAMQTRAADDESSPSSPLDMVAKLVEEQGVSGALQGLYRGIGATMGTLAVSQAIYFFTYESFKGAAERFRNSGGGKPRSPSALETLAVAYAAGAVNATVTSPLWTAAKRVQLWKASHGAGGAAGEAKDPPEEPTLLSAMASVVADEGVGGLFRSLPVSLVLCANPAIQFLAYERLRAALTGKSGRGLSAVEGFAAGALAKAVATVVTFPLQVVQTRMQAGVDRAAAAPVPAGSPDAKRDAASAAAASAEAVADAESPADPRPRRPAGAWEALIALVAEGGAPALFRGMGPKLLQTVLNAAVMFAAYERLLGSSRLLVAIALHRLAAGGAKPSAA